MACGKASSLESRERKGGEQRLQLEGKSNPLRAVERRISWLEDCLAPRSQDQLFLVVQHAGRELALDNDRCIEILRAAGCIDPGRPICLVDLSHIPNELTAAELERHLRENGTTSGSISTEAVFKMQATRAGEQN